MENAIRRFGVFVGIWMILYERVAARKAQYVRIYAVHMIPLELGTVLHRKKKLGVEMGTAIPGLLLSCSQT